MSAWSQADYVLGMLQLDINMIKIGQKAIDNAVIRVYPGLATPTSDGNLRISLGAVATSEVDQLSLKQRMIIRMFGGVMKATPSDLENPFFRARVKPFVLKGIASLRMNVRIGEKIFSLGKKTKKNGQIHENFEVDADHVSEFIQPFLKGVGRLPFEIFLRDFPEVIADGEIHVLQRHGLSVITDIDDTIKETSVGNRQELLANTFLREFQTISGMPMVYQKWADNGAGFHYVSSSPWQLFGPLHEMNLANGLPPGSFHLKNFRFRDQLFKKVALRTRGKSTSIRALLEYLPERQFVLIGDSGERDPEIYAKICSQYPERIRGVFIREISQRPLDEKRENRLRRSLAKGRINLFHSAAELEEAASSLFDGT